jgi:hypothetical protein
MSSEYLSIQWAGGALCVEILREINCGFSFLRYPRLEKE